MIEFEKTDIQGLYKIKNFFVRDHRGVFVKTYHEQKMKEIGFDHSFKESYYSLSVKDVIRGMHFQAPPHDHEKLVYVTNGSILDVILDIRKSSPSYGKYVSIKLEEFGDSVFIPKGCAHGFLTQSIQATVVYNVTTIHNVQSDTGVHWNSFGFTWPAEQPIVSDRDNNLMRFSEHSTIFP